MPSRPFPSNPNSNLLTKTRVVFIALTISASLVILASILYFLYHLWRSVAIHRAKTIPIMIIDSESPPLTKLQAFTYRELRIATENFSPSNVIGKGGSGTVFRGHLGAGINKNSVAVKRLDAVSEQSEREFRNELQILGGLRSPFLVNLLGFCVEKNERIVVYEYMPNKSLQDSLFGEEEEEDEDVASEPVLSWQRRFDVIVDVARALEFLHLRCDPPVIHGDIKPSNVLLDSDLRAKVSDFGLSRIKDGEFSGAGDNVPFSQELSGNLTPVVNGEVDFSLALQASSSSAKHSRSCSRNVKLPSPAKGKEVSISGGGDWDDQKFVPYDGNDNDKKRNEENDSKEQNDDGKQQWGKDWWWRQEGGNELCTKDYVSEWIGTQICPNNSSSIPPETRTEQDEEEEEVHEPIHSDHHTKKAPRKMQEWWREEHLSEIANKKEKKRKKNKKKFKTLEIKLVKKSLKIFRRRLLREKKPGEQSEDHNNGEFSFRRGWRRNKNNKKKLVEDHQSQSEMMTTMFSRELSSTTSMRGTLCYVAPECQLAEKADVYSFGVLVLVLVSGRRPLHVLASPMKLEQANLVSWCRHLAASGGGDLLDAVDPRLAGIFDRDQAHLCLALALACLHRLPEFRPDAGDIVRILIGEMDLPPPPPVDFSPSPTSRLYGRSTRSHKFTPD